MSAFGSFGLISSPFISAASPAHYVHLSSAQLPTIASGGVSSLVYGHFAAARVVDVILYQVTAGTVGTSVQVDLKNGAGVSYLTTLPVSTVASGNDKVTDARASLSLPSGWTRPVLKTDATIDVTKGARFAISTIETGSYSTHAQIVVVVILEPKA